MWCEIVLTWTPGDDRPQSNGRARDDRVLGMKISQTLVVLIAAVIVFLELPALRAQVSADAAKSHLAANGDHRHGYRR